MKRESTPFAILEVKTPKNHESGEQGGIWAKFYWSQNSGIYGHQVITEFNDGQGFKTDKTGGCGFCKSSAALEHFIKTILGRYVGLGGDLDYYLRGTKYHKGGNAFEVPLNKLDEIGYLNK